MIIIIIANNNNNNVLMFHFLLNNQGGNAIDAMVTTDLCVGVVHSFATNMGGGGVTVLRTPEFFSLLFSSFLFFSLLFSSFLFSSFLFFSLLFSSFLFFSLFFFSFLFLLSLLFLFFFSFLLLTSLQSVGWLRSWISGRGLPVALTPTCIARMDGNLLFLSFFSFLLCLILSFLSIFKVINLGNASRRGSWDFCWIKCRYSSSKM